MAAKRVLAFLLGVLALALVACQYMPARDPLGVLATATQPTSTPTMPRPPASTPAPTIPPNASTPAACWQVITGVPDGRLFVRAAPDANAQVVAWLAERQRVTVLEQRGDWARLRQPAGWAAARYLERCP